MSTNAPQSHGGAADGTTDSSAARRAIKAKNYKGFAYQFSTYVLISTFSINLIVSFLSFARDIMFSNNPTPATKQAFETGMSIALLAAGLHVGVIIVGSRAAALCFRLGSVTGDTDKELEDQGWDDTALINELRNVTFVRYVVYCERLHLIGILMLLASILYLSFSLFTLKAPPYVFLAASAVGALSIFATGFWSVSMIRESTKTLLNKLEVLKALKVRFVRGRSLPPKTASPVSPKVGTQ